MLIQAMRHALDSALPIHTHTRVSQHHRSTANRRRLLLRRHRRERHRQQLVRPPQGVREQSQPQGPQLQPGRRQVLHQQQVAMAVEACSGRGQALECAHHAGMRRWSVWRTISYGSRWMGRAVHGSSEWAWEWAWIALTWEQKAHRRRMGLRVAISVSAVRRVVAWARAWAWAWARCPPPPSLASLHSSHTREGMVRPPSAVLAVLGTQTAGE